MLTSDTMSILAMSMLMPTSTGAPVENLVPGISKQRSPQPSATEQGSAETIAAALTSEIRPQPDVVAFQQLVHCGFHIGHVARFVGAEARKHISFER